MPSVHQLNVSLTDELDLFVRGRVEAGLYATSSEVIREGLRLLQQREKEADEAMARLKEKLHRASEEADRGELLDSNAVFARLDSIIERHRSERASKGS
jgi:antitoxin ParD1/3/4